MSKIIESYTRESGVRNLEREIGSVCRAKAVEYAEAKDSGNTGIFMETGDAITKLIHWCRELQTPIIS